MDIEKIADLLLSNFKNTFHSSTTPTCNTDLLDVSNYVPSTQQSSSLADSPTQDEIKMPLFEMSPLKAPGPDGFHPIFFQKSWDLLAHHLTAFIQNIFQNATLPTAINETILCLIPKCSAPSEVQHFRPISLCNTIYKLVTKILFNRLKRIMPTLITPH